MKPIVIEYALPEWTFHHDRRVEIVAYTDQRSRRHSWIVETTDTSGYNALFYGRWSMLCERLQLPALNSSTHTIRRWYRMIPDQEWTPVWWVVSAMSELASATDRPIVSIEVVTGTNGPNDTPIALASNIWSQRQLDILWIGDQRSSVRSLITIHLLDLFHRHLQKQAIPRTGTMMPGLSQEQAKTWFAGMFAASPYPLMSVYWSEWRSGGDEVSVDVLRGRLLSDLPMIHQRCAAQVQVDGNESLSESLPSVASDSQATP